MGVVSSGPVNKVCTSLMATNLETVFADYLFSAYEAQCWNPDPSLYHYAASLMGYAAEDCLSTTPSSGSKPPWSPA